MAYRTGSHAYAASSVRTVTGQGVADLGILSAAMDGDTVHASWSAFGGSDGCFSRYQLVGSIDDTTPSSAEGAVVLWTAETIGTGSAVSGPLDPGTYHLRLEMLRDTIGDPVLAARTTVATVTVP
jgi:hypothetical protein